MSAFRSSRVVAGVAAALGLAGCGALPPQAPVPAAGVISRATTSIAAACGESYRLQAFSPHPDLTGLEASARRSARQLEAIRARHPHWVYQGQTLTQIAGASVADLTDCSLPGAARILQSPRPG